MKCFDVRESIESVNALVRTFAFRLQSRISGFLDQSSACHCRLNQCGYRAASSPLISLTFRSEGNNSGGRPNAPRGFSTHVQYRARRVSFATRDCSRAIDIPGIEDIQMSNLPGNIQKIIMG
jgi:hypothetical protein